MRLASRRSALLALAAGLALAGPARAAEFAYKDWRLDTSEVAGPPSPELERSLRSQFDIVDSLRGRIEPEAYAFFHGLPLRLVAQSHGGAGDYQFGGGRLNLTAKVDPPANPVLLHEMLHAFHDKKLGRYNPKLRALYAATVQSGAFPAGAYMLKNPAEFFAMCGSVALWGQAARPPLTRENLKAKAPDVYAWIVETFGFTG